MPRVTVESARQHSDPNPLALVPEASSREYIEILREEFDGYYQIIKSWESAEPDVVLQQASGISARLTEVRAMLLRDRSQRANRLRIDEVDPLLEQLEFQFRLHSRLHAIREHDFKLAGGQT